MSDVIQKNITFSQTEILALKGPGFVNPVVYEDGRKHTAPDPFVIEYLGEYYCYATDENGITVSTSLDMVHWKRHGFAYQERDRKMFWAPSVVLLNGMFYMYFSNMPANSDDTHEEIMRVATSTNPLGPFEMKSVLFDSFAIDSQVVRGEDGILYLLYADNQVTGLSDFRPGTSVMIDRLDTPLTREGNPKPLIVPTMDEEIFARNRFGDGRDWHTVEGATYFTHRNWAYITYSANAYDHEDYFVGYSLAPLGDGRRDHIDELKWTKSSRDGSFDPLLIRSREVEGTGHNSIVKAPNRIDDWIVYHARSAKDVSSVGTEQRVMRLDPLYYAEEHLDTVGPTAMDVDAPGRGDVRSFYPHAQGKGLDDELDNEWCVIEGVASTRNGRLETDPSGRFVALRKGSKAGETYSLSTWMCAHDSPLGARFGLVLSRTDADNLLLLGIDLGAGTLGMINRENGVEQVRAAASLRAMRFDFTSWHLVTVNRCYSDYSIEIDGHLVLSTVIDSGQTEFGIYSIGSRALFSSLNFVDHVDLWGHLLSDIPREIRAEDPLRFEEDRLLPAGPGKASFSTRRNAAGYRFVLDFELNDTAALAEVVFEPLQIHIRYDGVTVLDGDGNRMEPQEQPKRLKKLVETSFRSGRGHVLRTLRFECEGGAVRIHVRGLTWQFACGKGQEAIIKNVPLRCSLMEAALTGYERTSLGI